MKVSYRYRVQGRVYTGNRPGVSRVGSAGCDDDRAVVQQWMTSLAPGQAVVAYYDPDDPGHSAIRLVGLDAGDYAFCVTALLLLVAGVLTLHQANSLKPLRWTKD